MFTSIRKYMVRRGSAKELARRVQDDFVPLMRQMQGFRGYYLLDGGPDVLIRISMFDSADEALLSNEKAADWVRNNVLEFTKGMPEVMGGMLWSPRSSSSAPRAMAQGRPSPCQVRLPCRISPSAPGSSSAPVTAGEATVGLRPCPMEHVDQPVATAVTG
jgi:hypothetical protein